MPVPMPPWPVLGSRGARTRVCRWALGPFVKPLVPCLHYLHRLRCCSLCWLGKSGWCLCVGMPLQWPGRMRACRRGWVTGPSPTRGGSAH